MGKFRINGGVISDKHVEGKGVVVIVVEPLDLGRRLKDLEAFFLYLFLSMETLDKLRIQKSN